MFNNCLCMINVDFERVFRILPVIIVSVFVYISLFLLSIFLIKLFEEFIQDGVYWLDVVFRDIVYWKSVFVDRLKVYI